jgi:hypothetical protein
MGSWTGWHWWPPRRTASPERRLRPAPVPDWKPVQGRALPAAAAVTAPGSASAVSLWRKVAARWVTGGDWVILTGPESRSGRRSVKVRPFQRSQAPLRKGRLRGPEPQLPPPLTWRGAQRGIGSWIPFRQRAAPSRAEQMFPVDSATSVPASLLEHAAGPQIPQDSHPAPCQPASVPVFRRQRDLQFPRFATPHDVSAARNEFRADPAQ